MPYIANEFRKSPSYSVLKEFEIVDVTGESITVTFYSDGEVTFWASNGTSLNFSKENVITLKKAFRILEELPTKKVTPVILNKAIADYAMMPPEQLEKELATPLPIRTNGHTVEPVSVSSEDIKPLLRSVKREDSGWGATVQCKDNQYRYYYATRDQARKAEPIHHIGDEGRIA